MPNHRSRLVFACLIALTCLFGVGCGPKGPPQVNVTGSVSWQGKPVATGIVTLYSAATGQGASAEIGADGTFKIEKLIVGPYQVSVGPSLPKIPGEGEKPKPVPPFPIPGKYHQERTSGLTFEAKADTTNTLTLDLK